MVQTEQSRFIFVCFLLQVLVINKHHL